ncbi:hypothetical protein EDB82DRAFT_500477 [Fusarium venenatum]|uniref:uncharacterized protein n=1 Tax=Fusarium venenatum TaxID=56646 RepID=UPI001D4C9301|nr:hypothetical protein EDB82DRAFT_500477 [Fusarium venenatum]
MSWVPGGLIILFSLLESHSVKETIYLLTRFTRHNTIFTRTYQKPQTVPLTWLLGSQVPGLLTECPSLTGAKPSWLLAIGLP